MAHATYMAAMNAARKQFGKDWKESATLEKVDGQWYVQVIQKSEEIPAEILAADEEAEELDMMQNPDAPEYQADAPAEPVMPLIPRVAELEAPAPTPAIPAFLTAPSQTAFDVALAAGEITPAQAADVLIAQAEEGMILDALPQDDPELAALQAAADTQANVAAVNDITPLRPRISTAEKPTKKVWAIADSMPGAKRKDVIEECVRQGIAYGTARTQYQHWFKCINDQKVAPLAVIGANGAITIINQGEADK